MLPALFKPRSSNRVSRVRNPRPAHPPASFSPAPAAIFAEPMLSLRIWATRRPSRPATNVFNMLEPNPCPRAPGATVQESSHSPSAPARTNHTDRHASRLRNSYHLIMTMQARASANPCVRSMTTGSIFREARRVGGSLRQPSSSVASIIDTARSETAPGSCIDLLLTGSGEFNCRHARVAGRLRTFPWAAAQPAEAAAAA